MLRDFIEMYPDKKDRVGNTSFKKIAKALTSHDQKARKAVDYVSGNLLYDNFEMLRRIVRCSNSDCDALLRLVNFLEAFMKKEYEEHVNQCDVTETKFSLSESDESTTTNGCSICSAPHRTMEFLKSKVDAVHHQLLNDCCEKIKLYQGHRVRVANQRRAIDNLLNGLRDNQAYLVMDFKMKFEAIYYREKTTDFYGKKGSSWHGVMVYTRYTEEEKLEHYLCTEKVLEPHHISYFDQISSGDSTQDWAAVLTYFEASCLSIIKQFPHVCEMIVQTDNARAYKTPELILGMKLVAEKHGLRIVRYIHTGVQDGKGPIDGHFAVAMKHVLRYCNSGNNVVTPVQIVDALRSNGGVNNSISEMISINRPHIARFIQEYRDVIGRISHVKGHAEVVYDYSSNSLTTFNYSNIGDGTVCSLNVDSCDDLNNSGGEDSDDDDGSDNANNNEVFDEDELDESREMICTARGEATGCIIYGGQLPRRRRRISRSMCLQDIESEDEDELQCQTCNQKFTYASSKARHVCKGIIGRRPLLQFALAYAFDTMDQHDIDIVNASEERIESRVFGSLPYIDTEVFEAGWASTPPHGRMYGRKYIEPFKDDIVKMYTEGVKDSSRRLGPGRMLEHIRRKNPGRLDLPSENEIRQAITTLVAKAKKGKVISLTSNRGIAQPYLGTIISIFRQCEGKMRPKDFYNEFLQVHSASDDERSATQTFPERKQVLSKFSQLKSKFNKTNILPILPSS